MLGINLPAGTTTATQHLGSILTQTARQFDLPCPRLFALEGQNYRGPMGHALIEFEAQRAIHPQRAQIAEFMAGRSQALMEYRFSEEKSARLQDYLLGSVEALPVRTDNLGAYEAFVPRISYEGREVFEGRKIADYVERAWNERKMTKAAARALTWVSEQPSLDMRDRRVVVLGGGAELSPAEVFLRAGATVLWLDLVSPSNFIASRGIHSGTVVYPEQGADLLRQPLEIAATIEQFSEGRPVDIAAFAYAGGKAREWRLTAAMNAVIHRLNPKTVRSVGHFVSPTSVCEAEVEDMMSSVMRGAGPAFWQRVLKKRGILKDNMTSVEGHHWVDAMDPTQGGSYLAAQYLEKRIVAEAYAIHGLGAGPVTVSSNVAGISRTKNMQTPTYRAGFVGAPVIGLETYDPDTTRWQNGLLLAHDLLNPEAPGAASRVYDNPLVKAAALHSQQIHGGIYSYPYALQGAIGVAVLLGTAMRPWLLPPLVKSFLPRKKK